MERLRAKSDEHRDSPDVDAMGQAQRATDRRNGKLWNIPCSSSETKKKNRKVRSVSRQLDTCQGDVGLDETARWVLGYFLG